MVSKRKSKSYPWIPLESRWAAQKEMPNVRKAQAGQAAAFHARVSGKDYRLAEALLLNGDNEPFQKIKTYLARGHLEKAREELAALDAQADASVVELNLEKARLAAYEGEWETCVSYCIEAIAQNPPGISLLTFLQIRALACYEVGHYPQTLRDLESMDSLKTLYPYSPVYHYSKPLRIRLSARTGNLDHAWSQLDLAWKEALQSEELNLDLLLTLLRTEIDLRLFANRDASAFALASFLVAEVLGDRLYAALAKVDLFRSGAGNRALFETLEQESREYMKVRKLIQQHGLSLASIRHTVSDELLQARTLFFPEQRLLVHLKPFQAHVLNEKERLTQVISALRMGPLTKEELFKKVWGLSKYVPHLHENTMDQSFSRIKKKYGLTLKRDGQSIRWDGLLSVESV